MSEVTLYGPNHSKTLEHLIDMLDCKSLTQERDETL